MTTFAEQKWCKAMKRTNRVDGGFIGSEVINLTSQSLRFCNGWRYDAKQIAKNHGLRVRVFDRLFSGFDALSAIVRRNDDFEILGHGHETLFFEVFLHPEFFGGDVRILWGLIINVDVCTYICKSFVGCRGPSG